MQSVTIICIGKLKESYWRDACSEYCKRLGGSQHIQIVELDEERLPEKPSDAQIEMGLKKEGQMILSHIPSNSAIVTMCIEGKMLSSVELSQQMNKWAVSGLNKVTFVIGSSFGLSQEVKDKSHFRLSMSSMTFPHQMARVMLLEQLYRVSQIEKGGKYHK